MKFYINQNSHYSSKWKKIFFPHFSITNKDTIEFEACFDENCLYNLHTLDNFDVNKLFGVSTSLNHMEQSARIGWRCLNGADIQLFAYTHANWKIQEPRLIATVLPNEKFTCSIRIEEKCFVFRFKKEETQRIVSVLKTENKSKIKYLLYPYFGGNIPAPHDMSLTLVRKK